MKLMESGVRDFLRIGNRSQIDPSLHFAVVSERENNDGGGSDDDDDDDDPNKYDTVNVRGVGSRVAFSSNGGGGGAGVAKLAGPIVRALSDRIRAIGGDDLPDGGVVQAPGSHKRFDVCVVDEAGQVNQVNVPGALLLARSFLLIGDDKQLAPLVKSEAARAMGMDVSLFERLRKRTATSKAGRATARTRTRTSRRRSALPGLPQPQPATQPASEQPITGPNILRIIFLLLLLFLLLLIVVVVIGVGVHGWRAMDNDEEGAGLWY